MSTSRTRKSSPDPIARAVALGHAARPLARADAALGSLALAAVAILTSATLAGCTRPDTGGRPNAGGEVIQVDVETTPNDGAQPASNATFQPRGACPPPVENANIEPDGDSPRLAGEPPIVMPATATPPGSGSVAAHPNPPPLPGKPMAPHPTTGGKIP